MVKAACLDTRILAFYLKGISSAQKLIEELKEKEYEIYTTMINITEFFMGIFKINNISEEKIRSLKLFFLSLHPRTLKYETCVLAGNLYATTLKGREIGWRDTFIAAITLLNGKTIITSNKNHFNRIPDIEIIEYY
ncbi:MAG: type II toxin-antitoxin system VapC family toxin [Promethearchaeota archaeon]